MILVFARFILLARKRFTGSLHFNNVSWVSVINEIVKITNKTFTQAEIFPYCKGIVST